MSVGGVIGAAIGFYFGGPAGASAGYAIGSGVESLVNPEEIEGPRLEELRVQMSSYGAPIPFEYGTNRHAGTIIWPKIIELKESSETESAKGGPGTTSYTYSVSMAVLICEGPIAGVRRIWANKKLVYDATPGAVAPQDPAISGLRFYLGTESQEPDPLIEATDGPSPAYLGYAYCVFEDLALADFANRPPMLEFEVITEGNADVPPAATFGEAYGITTGAGQYDQKFQSAMDDDAGHLWVSTPTGHAQLNPETGEYEINPDYGPIAQIQEYDPATKSILRVIEITPSELAVMPMNGSMVYANGYIFIGAGAPSANLSGWGTFINTETGARGIIDVPECGPNGSFYWPSVPIPLIDNNGLYMAASNGIALGYAPGLMPASSRGVAEADYDAAPDRSTATPKWNLPNGTWAGRRHSIQQPPVMPYQNLSCEDGPLTHFALPFWATTSFVVDNPNAVVVQGYRNEDAANSSYVSIISHQSVVTSFNTDGPDYLHSVALPGSSSVMPSMAWDAENATLWAFAGEESSHYNTLYAIVPGPGGLTLTAPGFVFPAVPGESQGDDVKGVTIDKTTGFLRLILGGGFDNPVRLVLFDPVNQTIVQETVLETSVKFGTIGKMWDLPEQNKVIYTNGFDIHDIPYGNSLDASPVNLGAIVADLCRRAGLSNDDIDVAQLTDLVDGYIIPRQMSARAAIEPLQTAFFFDAVESDDKLKFVKRAASSPVLIPMEDRAARDFGADLPDSLSITRAQDMELPVQVDVEYADIDADHLVGNQYERRITRDTKQRINIQSPVVMTAEKAKQVAMVTLYRAWLNQSYKFSTTRKWAHLEPTDLVTLPTDSASYTARIVSKREQPGGIIEWEAAMEAVEVYTQQPTGAAPTNYVKQSIYDPGSTLLTLMDIPILRDADNNAGFYAAMGGTDEGWKGAQLFRSADGGSTYEPVLTQTNEAAIGFTQSALPDFADGNIFDAGSSVTVNMTTGQPLTSVTEDQVLNGANLAVIGAPGRWEVLQFKTATLIAPDTYQVSGLLRGRRGTEWATGTHQVGDKFILASVNTWSRINAGDMGLPRLYKAPPFRTALSNSSAASFTDTAVGLKPFAPVDLTASRDDSNNLALSWNRRTRLAADTLHLPRPLGEESESYSVDIISDGEVVRTLTSSTPSVTYSAAGQGTDGITPGAPVAVAVHQLSATVGRGYPLEGTV